jgi:hypothetical protein
LKGGGARSAGRRRPRRLALGAFVFSQVESPVLPIRSVSFRFARIHSSCLGAASRGGVSWSAAPALGRLCAR